MDNSLVLGELFCSVETLGLLAPKCYDNGIKVIGDNRMKLGEVKCSAKTLAFLGYEHMPNDTEHIKNGYIDRTIIFKRTVRIR